jgi:hypothetical protein
LVADVVWGVDIFSSVEVSLTSDLLNLPTCKCLVLFSGHASPSSGVL